MVLSVPPPSRSGTRPIGLLGMIGVVGQRARERRPDDGPGSPGLNSKTAPAAAPQHGALAIEDLTGRVVRGNNHHILIDIFWKCEYGIDHASRAPAGLIEDDEVRRDHASRTAPCRGPSAGPGAGTPPRPSARRPLDVDRWAGGIPARTCPAGPSRSRRWRRGACALEDRGLGPRYPGSVARTRGGSRPNPRRRRTIWFVRPEPDSAGHLEHGDAVIDSCLRFTTAAPALVRWMTGVRHELGGLTGREAEGVRLAAHEGHGPLDHRPFRRGGAGGAHEGRGPGQRIRPAERGGRRDDEGRPACQACQALPGMRGGSGSRAHGSLAWIPPVRKRREGMGRRGRPSRTRSPTRRRPAQGRCRTRTPRR